MKSTLFDTYLKEIEKNLATGQAGEHTHRPALKALLEAVGEDIAAINEPQRIACGAPDYILTRDGTPVGYVEAKDVGKSLDGAERSEQLARYRESLTNLILTDYLEFRWYVEGEQRETARLATVTSAGRLRTQREDPVVHFYETFLAAYDSQMRKTRGVYYTPEPVVSYIVHSLDHIVRTRFDRPLGLADTNTLILDPAVGTATFLYFVIQQIHETLMAMGQAGAWSEYVREHLLPRIFGFELLVAPYAMAHMKLGILLQETGYDFTGDQRLGIYLTNALEEAITQASTLGFAQFITDEANAAAEVKKEKPIMVVLGNPPYSVSSANQGPHIELLMDRYKEAVRDEQNIQPLSDDYIKFIRFAHDRIERTGYGVIGMITNHSYLSGLIHRGMREELMKTFDEIYVLNLHGNALMGETAPDGSPDENVFDIRQGVAIVFMIKLEGGNCDESKTSGEHGTDRGRAPSAQPIA